MSVPPGEGHTAIAEVKTGSWQVSQRQVIAV